MQRGMKGGLGATSGRTPCQGWTLRGHWDIILYIDPFRLSPLIVGEGF